MSANPQSAERRAHQTRYQRVNTRRTHEMAPINSDEAQAKFEGLLGSIRLLEAQLRANQVSHDAMTRWQAQHGASA